MKLKALTFAGGNRIKDRNLAWIQRRYLRKSLRLNELRYRRKLFELQWTPALKAALGVDS